MITYVGQHVYGHLLIYVNLSPVNGPITEINLLSATDVMVVNPVKR